MKPFGSFWIKALSSCTGAQGFRKSHCGFYGREARYRRRERNRQFDINDEGLRNPARR